MMSLPLPNPSSNGNGGGIPLPKRIPFAALTVIFAVFVQFVGLVVWASNEHNALVELQARFERYLVDIRRERDSIVNDLVERNKQQDALMQRLEVQEREFESRVDRG